MRPDLPQAAHPSDALTSFAARMSGIRGRVALDAAAAEVLRAFDSAGVSALLLKGPALARLLYRENETRGYSDVDLLVDPRDLPAARAALTGAGYVDTSKELGIDDVGGVVHAETWVGPDPDGYQTIDLHLRLPGATASAEAAWEALSTNPATIELAGHEAPVLARSGLALHLATHAAQHGPDVSKPLADLQLALDRWPAEVWRDATLLAREIGAIEGLAAGLRLLPAGAGLAAELDLPETQRLDWELANQGSRPRGTYHVEAFVKARELGGRLDVLRRALLPSSAWVAYTYPFAHRGRAHLVAAYVLHVLRAPIWAARAAQYVSRARRAKQ